MGDFLIDFRPLIGRSLKRVADQLRFADDTRVVMLDETAFGLVVTYTGETALWAPYRAADGTLIAVVGRAAFDEVEWESATGAEGSGGLAAKVVYQRYRRSGVNGLEQISGNCAIVVYDAIQGLVHLVTDCCGAFPVFESNSTEGLLYGSHPDVLADAANERHRLDDVSLAEFVLTSTVTPPFTYYERIRAVEYGTIITIALSGHFPQAPLKRRYFEFVYQGDERSNEDELAHEMAEGFRRSVRRRTLPRLGLMAVALSGGLDSRALLACVENKDQTFAFCCHNGRNQEYRIAEAIAQAMGIRFLPLQRDFDYYGDNAELGVRISGGMGSLANNHFLGMMSRLKAEGMQNLITGCYCDYLFKGLPLNRRAHWLTGREELAPFRHQFYFSHHMPSTPLASRVRERWESRMPRELQSQDSAATVFQVEVRRTFPLCYEGDNQQRVVPQRVTGWYLPVADRHILNIYCKLPYQFKLNRSVFLKTVFALSDSRLTQVPDANTGARPGASVAQEWISSQWLGVRRKLHRLQPSMTTDGSWPDWHYYVHHSRKLETLWRRSNSDAMDLFRCVLGRENVFSDVRSYRGNKVFLFVALLTLKLWLDQRR